MYAVIKTGGKQYKVAKDQILVVERLPGEAGDTLSFDEVLLVGDGDQATVGTPFVEGAAVSAELVEQTRGKKIIVFKKKRRKGYRRRKGHRQEQTVLRVMEVLTGGKKPAMAKAKAEPAPKIEGEAATPEKATPKAKAAPKKAPEKKAAEKKAPEKKAPEKTAAEKKATAKKPAAKKPAAKKTAGKATKKNEE